jgi:hypothetical protein
MDLAPEVCLVLEAGGVRSDGGDRGRGRVGVHMYVCSCMYILLYPQYYTCILLSMYVCTYVRVCVCM